MKSQCKIILIILIICSILSCNKNDLELTFGEKFIDSQTKIVIVDSCTVNFSTIKLDSIPTSNANKILVGHTSDINFGEINSTSYFELTTYEYDATINTLDKYDSITLLLIYSDYYGDTTQPFSLSVHQLKENIELNNDDYLYNTSTTEYYNEVLGNKIFYPRPRKNKPLEIRLCDDLGEELFEGLKNNTTEIINSESFLEYFKGIALVGNDLNNKAILGFEADTVIMRVHAHGSINDEIHHYDFPINTTNTQYNEINHDYLNTKFSSLKIQMEELQSKNSDGYTFIQGGTALATKVIFPHINDLLLDPDSHIVKAELIFVPDKSSYTNNKLPTNITIYTLDKYNNLDGLLYNSEGAAVISELIEDPFYHENNIYSFDVSTYIFNGITNKYFDLERGLLLCFESTNLRSTFNKVMINTNDFKPQLKLQILKY